MKLIKKVIAKINRTFVADCPKCHKHFYGFRAYKQHVRIQHQDYRYVCHRCAQEHVK